MDVRKETGRNFVNFGFTSVGKCSAMVNSKKEFISSVEWVLRSLFIGCDEFFE